jgi:hypothetical protein
VVRRNRRPGAVRPGTVLRRVGVVRSRGHSRTFRHVDIPVEIEAGFTLSIAATLPLERRSAQADSKELHATGEIVLRYQQGIIGLYRVSDAMLIDGPDESNNGRVIGGCLWECEERDEAAAITLGYHAAARLYVA